MVGPFRPVTLVLAALALTALIGVLASEDASASHFRSGSIHAHAVLGATNAGMVAELQGEIVLDAAYAGNMMAGLCTSDGTVDWGDGSTSSSSVLITKVDTAQNVAFGQLMDRGCAVPLQHTYLGAGSFPIQWAMCCRENDQVNNPNQFVLLNTAFDTTTVNRVHDASAWMEGSFGTADCVQWRVCRIGVPMDNPDGDALTARLATPCEVEFTCGFQQPEGLEVGAGGTWGFVATWDASGAEGGYHSVQVMIGDGTIEVPIDFRIHVEPNERPVADFTWDTPIIAGSNGTFYDHSMDPDGKVASWYWVAYTPGVGYGYQYSMEQEPSFYFPEAGTYKVQLRVTDDDGAPSDWKIKNVTVEPENAPPTADFFASGKGNAWTFTDASTDDKGVEQWYWDFGDGTNSTARHPTHQFAPGTYGVTLYVTDGEGITSKITKTLEAPCKQACTL